MNENTINNDVTMGGTNGALLAGRYRVVRQLGQGGMGSVWLAEDEKLDGHLVALKLLPSVLISNQKAYRQIRNEAVVSMRLTHPNIVAVRHFEENGGNPFIVADYIDGQNLDAYLAERGKITEGEVRTLLKPIAEALDYAHSQGVVHRDVKPSNVMVDKVGHPYILDFGVAREIQETMTLVTGKAGAGTLMYMSPEQLRGGAPRPEQDVYSFAAMMYECLAGHTPFYRGRIEYQILNEQVLPLRSHSLLAQSILQGLSKDSMRRPRRCADLFPNEATESHGMGRKAFLDVFGLLKEANEAEKKRVDEVRKAATLTDEENAHLKSNGPQSDSFVVCSIVDFDKISEDDNSKLVRVFTGWRSGKGYIDVASDGINCQKGLKTVLAKPGAWIRLFESGGHPVEVKEQWSEGQLLTQGVLCGEYELGLLQVPSQRIMELPDELNEGLPLRYALKYVAAKNSGADYFESHIGYYLGESGIAVENEPRSLEGTDENGCKMFGPAHSAAEMEGIDGSFLVSVTPKTGTVCRLTCSSYADTGEEATSNASSVRYAFGCVYKSEFDRLPGTDKWLMRKRPNGHELVVETRYNADTGDYIIEATMTDPKLEALILCEASQVARTVKSEGMLCNQ